MEDSVMTPASHGLSAALRAQEDNFLKAIRIRIEEIAWSIPAPNAWTPQLIEMAEAIRTKEFIDRSVALHREAIAEKPSSFEGVKP